jgi:hypothetical protein
MLACAGLSNVVGALRPGGAPAEPVMNVSVISSKKPAATCCHEDRFDVECDLPAPRVCRHRMTGMSGKATC